MLGVSGILLSLLLLMYLAYRNHSVIVVAPLCALVAVACEGELPWMASYTQIFLDSLSKFIMRYFPLFLLGAIFGKVMERTGSASSIAVAILQWLGTGRSVLALVLTCAILTYGGVSLFVVVFAVFPLARELFRQANVPLRLIPAAIALGAFTFTMTALPGSVQIQNLIPMQTFKTTSFAAPGLGCLAAVVMFSVGMLWLRYRELRMRRQGEGFDDHGPEIRESTLLPESRPRLMAAVMPLIVLMSLNLVCSQFWVPSWSAEYLSKPQFGSTELSKVQGTWSAILAMLGGLVSLLVIHARRYREFSQMLSEGAQSSLLPVFNAASEVGYGSTVAALSAFSLVKSSLLNVAPSQPLIAEALSVNVLAGITGSASGGLSIALEALGKTFAERGEAAGIDAEVLHRVASLACGGLDTLPHNAAVVTLLLICGCTHRESYWDIFVVSVLGPLMATVAVIVAATRW